MKSSNLKGALSKGQFVVTAEFYPPRGANKEEIEKRASFLKDIVDALVVADNPLARVHMSPLATAAAILKVGLEPIMQIGTRDRNRIAIQSDILGALALGVKSVFCLEDYHQKIGDFPGTKGVFDLDYVQLIQIIKKMKGVDVLVGTEVNPFADPLELHLINVSKKIKAGADFFQTVPIFNLERFKEFMSFIRKKGVYILAGVKPLQSVQMAQSLFRTDVPDEIIERLKRCPEKKQAEEGIRICVEMIKFLKEIKGVNGIHIFAADWEEVIPTLVREAGL